MRARTRGVLAIASALALVASCSDGDDGTASTSQTTTDAGADAVPALDPVKEALIAQRCPTAAWKSLYADFFGQGTAKPGSCTFGSQCHNGGNAAGTVGSHGYVCTDEETCCKTLIRIGVIQPDSPNAGLLGVVRHYELREDGGTRVVGFMPAEPADYIFDAAAITRIKAWIEKGGD